MATILTKKSDTSSSVPLAADLTNAAGGAELAVNTADKRLYSKTSGGSVVELGTNPSALSLPNGTANGVPYLNGSKVLTSGSALTFDGTALNVGIGGVGKIQVGTASSGTYQTGFYGSNGVDTDFQIRFKTGITEVGTSTATPLAFALSGSEAMRLTSTGLGIGTSSPGAKLHVKVGTNQNIFFDSSSGVTRITAVNDAVNDNIDLLIQAETLRFNTDGTERARLDASGNLLVGTTSSDPISAQVNGLSIRGAVGDILASAGNTPALQLARRGSDGGVIQFYKNTTAVGSVSTTSVLTTYNTTSDYRLKTVIGAVSDAGSRIDALEPIEYEWKVNGERTRGFLAHKFQEVYAGSVTGTKDAVDKEGKPVYQAMQASSSEVIADLVAEIQSLRKRLAALESK